MKDRQRTAKYARRVATGLTTGLLALALSASPVAGYEECGDQQDCRAAGYENSQPFEIDWGNSYETWGETMASIWEDTYDQEYYEALDEAWPEHDG